MLLQLLALYFKTKFRVGRFVRSFSIPGKYLVLDIGSGDSPFPAADVICEKFPWDDRERTAHFKKDRPLVVGDIEHLPFRDQAFDFIYCSHVLEHTVHPDKAIAELQRVGGGGYIEVPTSFHEKTVISYPGHLWFVSREGAGLVFRPKPSKIVDLEVNETVKQHLYDKDPLFQAFYYARLYKLFHIGLYWKKSVPFRIEQNESKGLDFDKASVNMSHGEVKEARPSNVIALLKSWIRDFRSRRKHFEMIHLIVCPNCKGPLQEDTQKLRFLCVSCQIGFPIRDHVPILLAEAASPSANH